MSKKRHETSSLVPSVSGQLVSGVYILNLRRSKNSVSDSIPGNSPSQFSRLQDKSCPKIFLIIIIFIVIIIIIIIFIIIVNNNNNFIIIIVIAINTFIIFVINQYNTNNLRIYLFIYLLLDIVLGDPIFVRWRMYDEKTDKNDLRIYAADIMKEIVKKVSS